MKVSVPPSGVSESSSPDLPMPETPMPDTPVTAPPAPSGPSPVRWPAWFGGADFAAAVLVCVAAFAVGSFTARNSDLYVHLATGRLMAEGAYRFGADPFSYSGESRAWVNPSWLWQRVAYQLFTSDPTGAWLVAAKAIVFAAGTILLLLVRRPGQPLWPWAVFAGLAVVAGGPYTTLRPWVVNGPFVALTLFILFRLAWKSGSWRNPILLAMTCGLWANLDGGFVLGPLTILLVLLGEWIQSTVMKGGATTPGAFGPPPPVAGLAKALGLAVVACVANPNHIHVWQLPPELGWGLPAAGMLKDAELIPAVLEPFDKLFWGKSSRGENVNGLAYLFLFLASALSMALSFSRIRVAHLLVWLLFGFLSLNQWLFILPFSVVSAALAAGYANLWSSTVELKTTAEPATRFYLLGSGVGRLITTALAIVMVPLAWPGYLHPNTGNPATLRRVAWAVEPDEGLADMATTVKQWRAKGLLPADVRTLTPNLDFANYLAWYAPGEKVYFNSRFGFHATEWPDALTIRQELYLNPVPVKEGGVEVTATQKIMGKAGAVALAAVGATFRPNGDVLTTLETTPGWSVWAINGRGTVVGPDTFPKLAFDPVRELFGPDVTPLPDVTVLTPPAPRETWLDDFLTKPKAVPYATDEANALRDYAQFLGRKLQFDHARQSYFTAAVAGGVVAVRNRGTSDGELAVPLLAVRAARRALAENPDAPETYFGLSQLYSNPLLPELFAEDASRGRHGERQLQFTAALQRYLARVPKPEACNPQQATMAFIATEQLAQTYVQTGQLDLGRDAFGPMKKYFLAGPGIEYQTQMALAGSNQDKVKAIKAEFDAQMKRLEDLESGVEKRVADVADSLRRASLKGTQKFSATLQSGLPATALKSFEEVEPSRFEAEYGRDAIPVAVAVVDLLVRAGRIEAAGVQLNRLTSFAEELVKDPKADPNYVAAVREQVGEREYRVRILEGNYRAAGEALERNYLNRFAPIPPAVRAAAKPQSLEAALALVGPAPVIVAHQPLVVNVTGLYVAESEFAYSRALLAVLDGRPAEAKARFAQCLAPQGEKGIPFQWGGYASRFLAMIEKAGAKP